MKRDIKPRLSGARSADLLAAAFLVIACLAIAYINSELLFGDWTIPKGDEASNDILVTDAKHLALFHGNYSRVSFYHPGPFYFQWMAIFEWLFVDTLRIFVSPYASEYFSVAVLHILAFALYLRLWLLWTGNIGLAVAALLITNAIPFGVIGSNYIGTTWPPHMYVASALMTVTGLLGMAARGPSWLPLFVVGLAQLVHGHASFIGLAPVMALTAVVVGWIGGRLPPCLWRRANAMDYVKVHPRPFYLSMAIAVLFALPILINTIVAWPGELPKYFQVAANNSHRIGGAILYVVSFVPMWGVWSLVFLLPAKHTEVRSSPADYRFAGLLVLVTGSVPAVFYAWRGIDSFEERYLILWMLPFVGAALLSAIFYFVSFLSGAWIKVSLIAAAAIGSLPAYGVITPTYPDIRSTKMTAAALDLLDKRTTPDEMIVLKLDGDPDGWRRVWSNAVSLIALMNRRNKNFLCIERSSWHLLFHKRYLCKQSDKISEMVYIVSNNTPRSDRLAELPDAEIVPLRNPIVGATIKFAKSDDVAATLLGDWSEPEPWGIRFEGAKAALAFDASRLPKKFSVLIRARLFTRSVRITSDDAQEIAVLANALAQPTVSARIELTRPTLGHFLTLNFEISPPVAPNDIGVNRDNHQPGIGLEQLTFEN